MHNLRFLSSLMMLLGVMALTGSRADASGMGFRFNRGIVGPPGSGFVGLNLVSLPCAGHCDALNLSTGGTVMQVNPANGIPIVHVCGGALPFNLTPLFGVAVTTPLMSTSGIVAGSHPDDASATFPIVPPVPAIPLTGVHIFPVPFHTTAVDAQDICDDAGLTLGAKAIRSDGSNPLLHICGAGLPFSHRKPRFHLLRTLSLIRRSMRKVRLGAAVPITGPRPLSHLRTKKNPGRPAGRPGCESLLNPG